MIEIITVGPQTSIQDHGRPGYLRYGVGCSGAMDTVALRAANIWLGNEENAAGIEIPSFPFRMRAHKKLHLAITGADSDVWIDDVPGSSWCRFTLDAGQTLHIGAPLHFSRCYLSVAGGWDVPVILGSRSTQNRGSFGGLEGRPLRVGDRLGVCTQSSQIAELPENESWLGFLPPVPALASAPDNNTARILRVLPAGEYDHFTDAAIDAFWQTPWKVSLQSNRAGYRLAGETLTFRTKVEMRSHGIVPGVIQVPPNGLPIIQLSDAHTAGGYPKIGTVIEADLWRLAQAPLGSEIRFRKVNYDEAIKASEELEEYFARLRSAASESWNSDLRKTI